MNRRDLLQGTVGIGLAAAAAATATATADTGQSKPLGRNILLIIADSVAASESLDDGADALFILGREEEGAEKRAMDAVAEGEVGLAQTFEQILRKRGNAKERGLEDVGPLVGGIAGIDRRCWSSGHVDLRPIEPEER